MDETPKAGSNIINVDAGLLETPVEAFQAIEAESARAGGAWSPPPGYEGSIGRTMFDTQASKDGTVTVLLPADNIDKLTSQALVPDRQLLR
jgi:hypothetical protein